jgi:hypothetical protein
VNGVNGASEVNGAIGVNRVNGLSRVSEVSGVNGVSGVLNEKAASLQRRVSCKSLWIIFRREHSASISIRDFVRWSVGWLVVMSVCQSPYHFESLFFNRLWMD